MENFVKFASRDKISRASTIIVAQIIKIVNTSMLFCEILSMKVFHRFFPVKYPPPQQILVIKCLSSTDM